MTRSTSSFGAVFRFDPLIGVAGGLAEVAWVGVYSAATPFDASGVARGVTETLVPRIGSSTLVIPLGIGIHILAVMLGTAPSAILRSAEARLGGAMPQLGISVGIFLVIWVANFMEILYLANPLVALPSIPSRMF